MDRAGLIAIALGGGLVAVAAVVLVVRLRQTAREREGQVPYAGPVDDPPRLEFHGGPLAGQVVLLTDGTTTIGSVAGNSVVLSDPAVSRQHVGVRRRGARFELEDLGSTNGVYVNGRRLPRSPLVPGDLVRVGNTEFVFRA